MAEREIRATAIASRAYDLAMSLVEARDGGADRLKMIDLIQDYLKESNLVAGAELQADLLEAVLDAPDRQARREPAHRLRLAVPADSHTVLTATLALVHLAETVPASPLPDWAREKIGNLGMLGPEASEEALVLVAESEKAEGPKRYPGNAPLGIDELREIAGFYDVELEETDDEYDGGASGNGLIRLWPSSFEKPWNLEITFWHELGHVLLLKRGMPHEGLLSSLACEGAAWETGLMQAAVHGRSWSWNSEEMKWARSQLATYAPCCDLCGHPLHGIYCTNPECTYREENKCPKCGNPGWLDDKTGMLHCTCICETAKCFCNCCGNVYEPPITKDEIIRHLASEIASRQASCGNLQTEEEIAKGAETAIRRIRKTAQKIKD